MDKLCSLVQDLLTKIKSKEAAGKLEAKLERFAQRWDKLVLSLQLTSTKVVMLMWFHLLCLIFSAILFHLFPFLSEFDMASCMAVPSLRINKALSLYLTLSFICTQESDFYSFTHACLTTFVPLSFQLLSPHPSRSSRVQPWQLSPRWPRTRKRWWSILRRACLPLHLRRSDRLSLIQNCGKGELMYLGFVTGH